MQNVFNILYLQSSDYKYRINNFLFLTKMRNIRIIRAER